MFPAGILNSRRLDVMNAFGKSLVVAAFALGMLAWSAPCAWAQEEDELDPLGDVIADMQVAGSRLAKTLTDKPTQQKQLDAVTKLDALIKLLEERRRQGRGNSSANPDRPAEDSVIMGGPGGSGPLHAARRNGNSWGQLPAHKREQILQSMTEGFPAHYQQILERYYRRLAEEKPADEAASAPPAKTAPQAPAAMEKKP
jgi:hypothetical protein